MDIKIIKSFIDLARKEGVQSLKYDDGKIKLSVDLPVVGVAVENKTSNPMVVSNNNLFENKNSQYKKITSPFVGTFYRSPSPDSDSFVEVGKKISSGSVLCIVEAMKIMNEIESDISGEIVEICVENESLVEYGQILFLVK